MRSYCGTGVARILLAALFAVSTLSDASAESLESALAHAYRTNPQLNAQRANLRNIDENVPQALSGYRPRISATADVGQQTSSTLTRQGTTQTRNQQSGSTTPAGFGVTGTQTLFNGFQTANRTRAAEGQVQQGREALRVLEQQVLLDAATAYMNILRDQAIVDLQRRNVEVLDEQLRQTRDRFNVGEVTRTDVAQSESRIAAARSQLLTAQANLAISRANYFRIVGREARALNAARPVDRLLPNTLDHAIALAVSINPNVTAAQYGVDVAQLLVKVNEGVLYPVLTLEGNAQQRYESSLQTERSYSASVVTRLTVPIYQGGLEYATIRQSKETVGERRFFLAQVRDQARATLVQAWSQLQAARAQIEAAEAQVSASELALNGVREEARVGQRTTLDVLNAQQELVNARVTLVGAQRDRVVASYAVLAAIGRNTPEILKLPTELYDPMVHYQQVRDAWSGVRTPDGK